MIQNIKNVVTSYSAQVSFDIHAYVLKYYVLRPSEVNEGQPDSENIGPNSRVKHQGSLKSFFDLSEHQKY